MRPLFVILLLLTACSGNHVKTTDNNSATANQTHKLTVSPANTTYMPTGFYFLADSSTGIKMRVRGSDNVYTIAPNAFASVKNIIKAELIISPDEKELHTSLRMAFDAKGTNELKEGTSSFLLHPKIAVIVANQLLYVVDNNAKITTGVMFVELMDYSDLEMKALQNQVEHKR